MEKAEGGMLLLKDEHLRQMKGATEYTLQFIPTLTNLSAVGIKLPHQ